MPLVHTLEALLDASTAARRPEPGQKLWLAPAGIWKRRECQVLLTRVLEVFREYSRHVQLFADADLTPQDIGPGTWRELGAGRWGMPDDFAAVEFLRGQLHAEGSYALVVSASDVVALPPGLPWWGPARWIGRAASITRGLRDASIEIALAVHHDASDWMLAIADESDS